MLDRRPHGLERGGELGDGRALDVVTYEDRALIDGQRVERPEHVLARHLALQQLVRAVRRALELVERVRELLVARARRLAPHRQSDRRWRRRG